MKKLMAAILCIALTLSCMSFGVFAEEEVVEEATSSVYTIDKDRKRVEGVAPFTTVQTFEGNWTTGDVQVVNVDGSEMVDTAYATDNVYAKINGEFYKIDVDWPYDSVQHYGRNYRKDGDVLFEKASANFNSTLDSGDQPVMGNSGFSKATSGYKLGYADGSYGSVASNHKTVVTKKTNEVGDPIYEIANNAPRYAFLRSHYIYSTSESNVTELTKITKGKISVTTATFKADMMGNFSIHHNAPGYASSYKSDLSFNNFTYTDHSKYIPNAVHFTEDGTVKIGGTYYNIGMTAAARTPGIATNYTWEAGKEYTVSIVQQVRTGADPARYAQVYGIYINGEKVFPNSDPKVDSTEFSYLTSGAFQMKTRSSEYKFTGGISAVLVGAAPKNANDNFSVELSDLKVYTIDAVADYKPELDKGATIELVGNDPYITVDNENGTVTSKIGIPTNSHFSNSDVKVGVSGNVLTAVSYDGLYARKYVLNIESDVLAGFYNGEEGPSVDTLEGVNNICYSALVDKSMSLNGRKAIVVLAVYNNDKFEGCVVAEGEKYKGEITKYKAVYDISKYGEADTLKVRGFIWNGTTLEPLKAHSIAE